MQNTVKNTPVYIKRFNVWTKLKRKVHNFNGPTAHCKAREVWWVSLGHNIGFEEDGKGEDFSRPVLVVKTFNKNLFFGIPLTSQEHTGDYYFKLEYNNVPSIAILSQARAISQKRLMNKVGVVPLPMFEDLKKQYKKNVLEMQ